MLQEQQPAVKKSVFSGLNTPTAAVNAENLVNRAKEIGNNIRVIHGANEGYFPVNGKTIGDVRKGLKDTFSLPGDAIAQVDGKDVNDDFVLASGQSLEFYKAAGTKGQKFVKI